MACLGALQLITSTHEKTAIASKRHTIINNFARVEVSKIIGPLPVFRRLSAADSTARAVLSVSLCSSSFPRSCVLMQ